MLPSARPGGEGPLSVGQAFGPRYHIIRLLGIGGMGAVYQAWDQELGVAVALKVIRPEASGDRLVAEDLARRFKRELLLARQVTHKNVVRIHDLGELYGIKYITMPYVQGSDLATVLKNEGTLSVHRALKIAKQLVGGLGAAHDAGVVHRDLKPANIMMDVDDHPMIMDFGIARSTAGGGGTLTGAVVGTLEYMAPEQAKGEEVDHRADLYAFGLILYDMLVGVRQPKSAVSELMGRMQRAPAPVRTINADIPEPLERVIERCLQPEAANRYQSAEELASDLACLDGEGQLIQGGMHATGTHRAFRAATAILPRRLRESRRWLAAGLAGILLLAIGVAYGVRVGMRPEPLVSSPAPTPSAPLPVRRRMAVVPFKVVGDQNVLGDVATGLEEALTAKLFQLDGVSLASPAAVERAGTTKSIEELGRELGVSHIVAGTVQGTADRLRIVVNLEDLAAKRRLWTQEFTGVPGDLLTLQDSIYTGLLGALDVTLSNEEAARAVAHPTENIEAYGLYLKGRTAMRGEQDPKNVASAINLYEEALKRDSRFALAYAGIADGALRMYRFTKESTWASKALSAAQQAQRLDDELVEVHLALGSVYQATGRTNEAIAELGRASELAPNSDESYRRLARAYVASGRADDAIRAHERAIAINPYYWVNYDTLGASCLQLGMHDRAIQAFQKVIELEPENVNGHNDLGAAYLEIGRFEEAARAFEKALTLLPNPETYTNLGISYYFVGKFNEAVPMFEKAVELSPNSESFVGNLGDGYRWAGQQDKARATYEKAIALALKELQVDRRNAGVRGSLGLYYAKIGDVKQADRFIRDARAIDRSNVLLMFEEAIIYALSNRNAEALTALEEALKAGYPVSMIRSDPDLRTVREDPRFENLLKRSSEKPN